MAELPSWPSLYARAFPAGVGGGGVGGVSNNIGGMASSGAMPALHGVFALHACDTATDEAIAFAVESRTVALLVAPCCQAELAAKWKRLSLAQHQSQHQHQQHQHQHQHQQIDDWLLPSSQPSSGDHAAPSSFRLIHRQPNLRREVAAHITDALRTALLRAEGYRVGVQVMTAQVGRWLHIRCRWPPCGRAGFCLCEGWLLRPSIDVRAFHD